MAGDLRLDGAQRESIHTAILDSFEHDELARFMDFRLNRRLDHLTLKPDLPAQVYDVMRKAETQGWMDSLLLALRHSRPDRFDVFEVASAHELSMPGVQRAQLEQLSGSALALQRRVNPNQQYIPVEKMASWLAQAEPRVCRISYPVPGGTLYGTGFLVGAGEVLTNEHVVRPIVDGHASPADVKITFDYRRVAAGVPVSPGTTYGLAETWCLDSSPHSPLDVQHDAEPDSARDPGQLDHVLLRLDGEPGTKPIGDNPEPGAPRRGWIQLDTNAPLPAPGTVLFILQHPNGEPLKIAYDTVLGVNENQTRLRYRVNTEGGSSGSPCFDWNLRLSALHHAGDPNFDELRPPGFNQGVPIGAIASRLKAQGLLPGGGSNGGPPC